MKVRLTQIDGKLPNLALMKLAPANATRSPSSANVSLHQTAIPNSQIESDIVNAAKYK